MKNTIIGREEEIQILDSLMRSNEAEMLAVYGRRRIGKTYLINEYFRNTTLFFSLTGTSGCYQKEQLKSFPYALEEAFKLPELPEAPKNWFEAFKALEKSIRDYKGKKKIVLFFDELPWLSGRSPHMLRALEHSWNSALSQDRRVIMVLCGSAAAWIIKKIVRNTKGLYGRITQKIHLQPFTLKETAQYLASRNIDFDAQQVIEISMVTGGVAKYLRAVDPESSLAENIQKLCFHRNGFLYSEFSELFNSLFENPDRHLEVIRALAASHYGLTYQELVEASGIPSGGGLNRALDELEASGFVTSLPFYGKQKKFAKYRVIDAYTLFYLRWIEPTTFVSHKTASIDHWSTVEDTQAFKVWSGYAFENLCLRHIDLIVDSLRLSVVIQGVSFWKKPSIKGEPSKGSQIDLILERRDKAINLCEIKFCNGQYCMNRDYAGKLIERKELFRSTTGYKGSLFNTLITPQKCKKNAAFFSSISKSISLDGIV